MTAYIEAADVLAALPQSTRPVAGASAEDDAKIARLASLCVSTAEMIDAELKGMSFHRDPALDEYGYDEDATTTRILDGRAERYLHVHGGIVSLTSVEYRYGNNDWTAYEADAWEVVSFFEDEDDRPYDHVFHRSYRWPAGTRNVRLTGVFGWSDPPARLVEMNVAWVRQHLAAGNSYSGALQVPDGVIQTPRLVMPDDVRLFLTAEKNRYRECWT